MKERELIEMIEKLDHLRDLFSAYANELDSWVGTKATDTFIEKMGNETRLTIGFLQDEILALYKENDFLQGKINFLKNENTGLVRAMLNKKDQE